MPSISLLSDLVVDRSSLLHLSSVVSLLISSIWFTTSLFPSDLVVGRSSLRHQSSWFVGTVKEVWDSLLDVYQQPKFAKWYELETAIQSVRQWDQSIQDFYIEMTVPASFWREEVLTVVFLLNRMLIPLLSGQFPYKTLFSRLPNYFLLCVFGSACFVLLPRKDRTKLSVRSVLYVFLGYSLTQKGYRSYDPISHHLYISHHVSFFERLPYFQFPPITTPVSKEDLVHIDPFPSDVPHDEYISIVPHDLTQFSLHSPQPIFSHRSPLLVYSRRQALPPLVVYTPTVDPATSDDSDPAAHQYPTRAHHPPNKLEPQSYKEACQNPHWIQAMEDKLSALQKTSTWDPSLANKVIHRASLTDTKISDTPIELNVKLNTTDGVPLDDLILCHELVGYLVYLIVTRPDRAYVVHVKQTIVAHSTAEVEYHAMAHATAKIAHNTVFHERTKYIEIDCHFVRQHLQSGSILLSFVHLALQLTDFLAKTHTTAHFRFLLDKLFMFLAKTPQV
ncbi:uncharacterized protein LOC114271679 [Camellia sinensis]|uniref:uncharacterized protein LOC114271679 n=1 Tax=Camellia sinensis TaxID=4442 RepID=UPI00103587FC|nr:uncharacterized protein LOC114271679 [Camellia sinensis]